MSQSTQPPLSTVTHSTFGIERDYSTTLSRVFDAFADSVKMRRWIAEGEGFIVDNYGLDFSESGREYGKFRMAENTPLEAGRSSIMKPVIRILCRTSVLFLSMPCLL